MDYISVTYLLPCYFSNLCIHVSYIDRLCLRKTAQAIAARKALKIDAMDEFPRADNLVIYGVPDTHSDAAAQSENSTTTRPARDTSATSEHGIYNKLNLSI